MRIDLRLRELPRHGSASRSDRAAMMRHLVIARASAWIGHHAVVAVMLILGTCLSLAPAAWSEETPYGPSTFKILDPATSRLIGQVRFTVTLSANGAQAVESDARYLNGDYDREEDHLVPAPGGGPLRQVSFAHRFFHRDGSPDRSSQANFLTGAASCTINENGRPSVHAADFRFGADTYAGAPVVIPLRDALLAQTARVIEFHYFACVPGPRVVSVRATAGPPAPWPFASAPAVKVDLLPDFGWINAIIAPFLPSVAAWFEPSRQWYLAGVESARYYKGPKILMVASPQPPASGSSETAKALPGRLPAPSWPGAESLH